MPHSKNIESYNRRAENYEERWQKYLDQTHDFFLDHIQTGKDDILLDLSCGTGLLAHQLRERNMPFQKMALNDPSDKMLAIARERLGGDSRISFSQYPAHLLDYKDQSFTRVFCLNAFHFYHHQKEVLKEIKRILRPGGIFYVQDWNRSGWFRPVNTVIRWSVEDYIDTRSYGEMKALAEIYGFRLLHSAEWHYRYWKFFFIEAQR